MLVKPVRMAAKSVTMPAQRAVLAPLRKFMAIRTSRKTIRLQALSLILKPPLILIRKTVQSLTQDPAQRLIALDPTQSLIVLDPTQSLIVLDPIHSLVRDPVRNPVQSPIHMATRTSILLPPAKQL
jgi:hypothetical protein